MNARNVLVGQSAAIKSARAKLHAMIANRECVKCYGPADVDGAIACSTCIRERDEWNKREAAMLAAQTEVAK